ncbi:sugar ABC transporter permease [Paenibacillus sp. J2TS4]|uniref:ABC transporter permease n=1 Tax=Paenibacillus sp. J2TS4 TaxID=2807194 RepID=UPI001B2BE279|nr:ABC transporter permease subunit [Paenibacillus sp. J2TS4]GIP34228.1 sugar ABC transporter permease [Paenibacillus sp. J2TS4]
MSNTATPAKPPVKFKRAKPKRNWEMYFRELKKDIVRDRILYYLLVPFLLWFLIFKYVPMWGIQIAFKDFSLFRGIGGSEWIGFEYFTEFIGSEYFSRVFINTVIISLYGLVICFPAQILLAIMISEVTRQGFKKVVQTLTYLPHFVSVVVVAGIVTTFLAPNSGLINLILEKLGMEKIYFLTNPDYFRGIYTAMNLWKETGFASIVFIAAIAGIDTQLYEAAKMDGASKFKQIIHVTLPGILPTIVVMFIMKVGNLLSVGYETIILLYQPATYEKADVISTYVYRSGLIDGRYDFATAVGLFNSIVALILVIMANKLSKKVTDASLW